MFIISLDIFVSILNDFNINVFKRPEIQASKQNEKNNNLPWNDEGWYVNSQDKTVGYIFYAKKINRDRFNQFI